MYSCQYKIQILSGNPIIGEAAKTADPLEDCGFTVTFPESRDLIIDIADSALIIDADDADFPGFYTMHDVYKVIVIPAESADAYAKVIEAADSVWVDTGSKELFKAYYKALCEELHLRFDKRIENICFLTAINSIPDLVWFKDDLGRHLIVNDGFCKATDKTKEMIYKQGHYYIWDMPEEEYKKGDFVCLESEEVVMKARETVLFDEKVKTKMGMELFKTYKSPLIDADGTIFGTCGIAHDVTELDNVQLELEAVLDSMPFGVIVEGKNKEIVSANSKFSELFPDCGDVIGHTREYWMNRVGSSKKLDNRGTMLVVGSGDDEKILLMENNIVYDSFDAPIGEIFVFSDITAERKFEEKSSVTTDFTTGLHNSRGLFHYLETIKQERQITLTIIDIDNFKKFNEKNGLAAGDDVLKLTAHKLFEIYPTDYIACMGGDEYIAISTSELSEEEVAATAERAMTTLNSFYSAHEATKGLSVSLGIASQKISEGELQDISLLLQKSDRALSSAKKSGKARFCIF